MIIVIIMLSLLSCNKGINKIRSLFKRGNTAIDNRIEYKIERNVKLKDDNSTLFRQKINLFYIKDLNKGTLIAKDENQNTIAVLENKKFTMKNVTIPASNETVELIYHIFLYSSLELNEVLEILNIQNYNLDKVNHNLVKITYKEGYILYDTNDKVIKTLCNKTYDKGISFQNNLVIEYKIINRMKLPYKIVLRSESEGKELIIKEKVVE